MSNIEKRRAKEKMKLIEKIKATILDFDNCIVLDPENRRGSEELKDQAWYGVFKEYDSEKLGVVIEQAQKQIVGGKGDRRDIVRLVCEHFSVPREMIPAEIECRCEAFNAIVQAGILQIGVSPDNRQAIKALSEMMPVYINTATHREHALESLAALGLEGFTDVYGRPGTKIKNLQDIIKREGIDPTKVLYVGDQNSDWQAAQAVGCKFVGVQTARNTVWGDKPQEFPIVQSLAKILELEI